MEKWKYKYKENNLQDLWLTGENFKGSDLDKVKNTENVKDANRVLTLTTSLKDFDNVSLETNFIEVGITTPYTDVGKSYGGVLLCIRAFVGFFRRN